MQVVWNGAFSTINKKCGNIASGLWARTFSLLLPFCFGLECRFPNNRESSSRRIRVQVTGPTLGHSPSVPNGAPDTYYKIRRFWSSLPSIRSTYLQFSTHFGKDTLNDAFLLPGTWTPVSGRSTISCGPSAIGHVMFIFCAARCWHFALAITE